MASLKLKVDDKFKAFMQSGSLPEVSSTDNGMVLTVAEGAWAKANLPAQSHDILAVMVEGTAQYEDNVFTGYSFGTASKNASEITESIANGQYAILFAEITDGESVSTVPCLLLSASATSATFIKMDSLIGQSQVILAVDGDGACTVSA